MRGKNKPPLHSGELISMQNKKFIYKNFTCSLLPSLLSFYRMTFP